MGDLIGMTEAARRAGVSISSLRRSLATHGVETVLISANARAIDSDKLAAFLAARGGKLTRGRPKKTEAAPPHSSRSSPGAALSGDGAA